jgi:hypothetical protein
MLRKFDPEKGDYAVELEGSFPDTKIKIAGCNIRTEEPTEWEFRLWDFWEDWGTVNGTATVIYAQLAV